jgi:hypothetical protein
MVSKKIRESTWESADTMRRISYINEMRGQAMIKWSSDKPLIVAEKQKEEIVQVLPIIRRQTKLADWWNHNCRMESKKK